MKFEEHLKKYLSNEFITDLISSLDNERTNSILLNTNKISEAQFLKDFPTLVKNSDIDNAFYFNKNQNEMGKTYLFDNGAYYIMDAASLLTTSFLQPKDDDLILDMCAAPGGKTISLASKYPNCHFLANDISFKRCLTLSSNIEKLGLSNITVINNNFSKNYMNFQSKFDFILLDAPCSGSAMFRKSKEMKDDRSYEKVKRCQKTQCELIEYAYYMLKNGGTLVYSTCSFSYEENEEIIYDFLKKHSEMSPILLKDSPSFFHSNLKEGIHLFPNLYNGEGQFFIYLKKEGNSKENIVKSNFIDNKILNKYNLKFKYLENINDNLDTYNFDFNYKNIHTLKKGLQLGSFKNNIFIPSFHLAHYLPSKNSIPLNENEFKKYIHGEEIQKILPLKNDYYVVSYKNLNLGFIKYSNGKLKNLYPKGLRR